MRVCVCVCVVGMREIGKGCQRVRVWTASKNSKCSTNGSHENWKATRNPGHILFYLQAMWALDFASLHMLFIIYFWCLPKFLYFLFSLCMVQNCPLHLPRPNGFLILEYPTNWLVLKMLPQFQTPKEGVWLAFISLFKPGLTSVIKIWPPLFQSYMLKETFSFQKGFKWSRNDHRPQHTPFKVDPSKMKHGIHVRHLGKHGVYITGCKGSVNHVGESPQLTSDSQSTPCLLPSPN